jgi:imidazolonepropionase-like amidohydrolase
VRLLPFVLAGSGIIYLAATAVAPTSIVFRHVTVIDGTGAAPLRDMTVVVRGAIIERIEASRTTHAIAGARLIDGRGKYLLPGFIDTHAHVNLGPERMDSATHALTMTPDPAVPRFSLRSLLRFGVTTIRDPGGPTEQEVAVRDSVAKGWIAGPRIFAAGEVIDQTAAPGLVATVHTADDVRAEVRRQARLGVDYIKLYASLTPPLVQAGIDEAHALGKKAIGHLFLTSWTSASKMGIDGLLHAVPSSPDLLPPDKRTAFMRGITNTRFMFQWFESADLHGAEIDSMIAAMVRHRVEHDGTLVTFEAMAWGDKSAVTKSPDLVYAPPSLLANWRSDFTLTMGWKAADFDSARAVWPRVLAFEKLLFDRGVLVTVGTDANNPWTPPGSSFHREMALLVQAGISSLQVLTMATRNGAEALGVLESVGTVTAGKRADLVLLSADPVTDIRNTRQIELVMQGGQVLITSNSNEDSSSDDSWTIGASYPALTAVRCPRMPREWRALPRSVRRHQPSRGTSCTHSV